jgi:hypothetical protein
VVLGQKKLVLSWKIINVEDDRKPSSLLVLKEKDALSPTKKRDTPSASLPLSIHSKVL